MATYRTIKNCGYIDVEDFGFLSGFGFTIDKINETQFIEICHDILNNKDVNVSKFDFVFSNLLRYRINPLRELYDVIEDSTKDIYYTNIKNSINNNTFSNEQFINIYNNYVKSCFVFKKLFNRVFTFTKTESKNNTDKIYMITNYLFFKNVINNKYNNNYLKTYLNFNDNLQTVTNLIKIFGFYQTFMKQLNDKELALIAEREDKTKDLYLDKTPYEENDYESLTLDDNYITSDIIDMIINNIDTNIRTFESLKNSQELNNKVSETVEYIKIFTRLNKHDFIAKYVVKMQQRLLDGCNHIIENKLIGSFYNDTNNFKDINIICAKLIIDDFVQSNKLHDVIKQNINFNIVSDKYQNVNTNITTRLYNLSNELWNSLIKNDNLINSNNSIAFYKDMYSKSIPALTENKKTLDISNSQSIVTFDYTLSDNKTFSIKSNIILFSILSEITKHVGIKADSLQEILNLTDILNNSDFNILIKTKLIIKDNNNMYSINKEFNTDNLVLDLYNYKEIKLENKQVVEINDNHYDDSESEKDDDDDDDDDNLVGEIKIDEDGNEYIEVIEEVEVEEGEEGEEDEEGEEVYYEEVEVEVEEEEEEDLTDDEQDLNLEEQVINNVNEKIEEIILSDDEDEEDDNN